MEISSRIFFASESLRENLKELKDGKTEELELYYHLNHAFDDLKKNCYSGIQIPKKLIPKLYTHKYSVTNLWKYDLPRGWRLIYTIGKEGVTVLSVILEWMDHKEYERRFNY